MFANSGFLEIFQKPPSELFVAAKQFMQSECFLGSWRGTAWKHDHGRQATHACNPVSRFLNDVPSGDELPLGNTS